MLATASWADVVLALAPTVAAIAAAVIGWLNRWQLRTKNGSTVAETVDEARRLAEANHVIMRRTLGARKTDRQPPPPATGELVRRDDADTGELDADQRRR